MPAPSSHRAEIVRACVLALAALDGPPAEPVEVEVRCGAVRIVAVVTPEEARAILGPPAVGGLSPAAAALLSALSAEPRTAKALARAAGYSMGSHVYVALRELEGRGLCEKTAKGYRLRGQ